MTNRGRVAAVALWFGLGLASASKGIEFDCKSLNYSSKDTCEEQGCRWLDNKRECYPDGLECSAFSYESKELCHGYDSKCVWNLQSTKCVDSTKRAIKCASFGWTDKKTCENNIYGSSCRWIPKLSGCYERDSPCSIWDRISVQVCEEWDDKCVWNHSEKKCVDSETDEIKCNSFHFQDEDVCQFNQYASCRWVDEFAGCFEIGKCNLMNGSKRRVCENYHAYCKWDKETRDCVHEDEYDEFLKSKAEKTLAADKQ